MHNMSSDVVLVCLLQDYPYLRRKDHSLDIQTIPDNVQTQHACLYHPLIRMFWSTDHIGASAGLVAADYYSQNYV